ncbi:MAG TPA: glycosyltransferase family 4 protein [Gemmatimonadales bacterium]|nr:glycosyltransferase family 4 protein [Gemmatimonadales bacterium]
MMGELALRYPPHSLVVSTGTYPDSAASDARFSQTIDRVGIRATRLRTINGLALWTWRASALARRHRPGFAWCGELKPAGYPARFISRRQGVPYGVVVHGTELLLLDAKIRRSRFKRWTAGGLLSGAAVIAANSTWTGNLAKSVLELLNRPDVAKRVRVVPLGTEPREFRPGIDPAGVRERYRLDGGPWILTVARIEWHKGIDTMIKAMPAIRAAHPGARYAIAGAGPRQPQLEELARETGVADAVRFLGPVSDADLPALYNSADLYVGASRRHDLLVEGFGISLVEASASGLAVVGGRSGGVPDAVRDGETGILVDPDQVAAVAAGVNQLLSDEPLRKRLGAAGRKAVEQYYNWDRVAKELIDIDREFRQTT